MLERPPIAKEGEPRCNSMIYGQRQCTFRAVKEASNCVLHGGKHVLEAMKREDQLYNLREQYRNRIDELTDNKKHFTLNEEIGVLRMLLENIFKTVNTDNELLRNTSSISELITKIEKLVNSAMRAEKYIGGLLSRNQAIQMIQEIVDVMADEIKDPDLLNSIASKFEVIVRKDYIDSEDPK